MELELSGARVERRRPWLFAVPALFLIAATFQREALYPLTALGVLVLVMAPFVRRRRTGTLRVSASGDLTLDGVLIGRCPKFVAGRVMSTADGTRVALQRADVREDVTIVLPKDADARRLLRALRLDPQTGIARAAVIPGTRQAQLANVIAASVVTLTLAWGITRVTHALDGVAPFAVIVVAALFGFWRTMRLDVGDDGVLVSRFLCRPRFLRFAEIANVHFGSGVEGALLLASGETIRFFASPSRPAAVEALESVLRRIEASVRVQRRPSMRPAWTTLARGGRTADSWIRELKSEGGAEHYRQAAVRESELWRVIADPASPGTARVGAAVALSPALDTRGRDRLRTATATVLQPRVRVALDAVAGGADSAHLVGAVAPLDDPTAGDERATEGSKAQS